MTEHDRINAAFSARMENKRNGGDARMAAVRARFALMERAPTRLTHSREQVQAWDTAHPGAAELRKEIWG